MALIWKGRLGKQQEKGEKSVGGSKVVPPLRRCCYWSGFLRKRGHVAQNNGCWLTRYNHAPCITMALLSTCFMGKYSSGSLGVAKIVIVIGTVLALPNAVLYH